MVSTQDFEAYMQAWGRAFHEDPPRDRGSIVHNPIARALPFAPKTVARATAQLLGRSGVSRRKRMAEEVRKLGVLNVHLVPKDYVDPVPTKSHCHGGGGGHGAGRPVHPTLARIQRECVQLEEINLVRGLVFRAQYCVDGDTAEKALWVTDQWRKVKRDALVSINQYRNELAFAKVWMQARLNEDLTAISAGA